jgi:hypothetical protein
MLISAAVSDTVSGGSARIRLEIRALTAAFDLDITAVLHQRQITGVDGDGQVRSAAMAAATVRNPAANRSRQGVDP